MKHNSLFSKIVDAMDFLGGLIVLNLCFLVCCIPVVTIGTAVTALYTVTLQEADHREGTVAGRFFTAFCANFRQATVCWLIVIPVGLLLGYDFFLIYWNPGQFGAMLRAVLIVCSLFAAVIATYVFPLLARYDNTVKATFRNAFVLGLCNPLKSALMLLLNFLLPLAFYCLPILAIILSVVWVFIGFAAVARINSCLLIRIFHKVDSE